MLILVLSVMSAFISRLFSCFDFNRQIRASDAIIERLDAIEQKIVSLNDMRALTLENDELKRQMHRVSQELNRTRQMYGWVLTGSRDDCHAVIEDEEPQHHATTM